MATRIEKKPIVQKEEETSVSGQPFYWAAKEARIFFRKVNGITSKGQFVNGQFEEFDDH